MIIWINGAYGVGKTTTAKMLKRKITKGKKGKVKILNSDCYFNCFVKKNLLLVYGGTLPQNNLNFIKYFKEIIEKEIKYNILIIDMALTEKECKSLLFEPLNDTYDILHIILTGSDEIIKSRINSDKTSERDISFLPSNLEFLKNNFDDAIRIDTSKKKPDAIVTEILRYF